MKPRLNAVERRVLCSSLVFALAVVLACSSRDQRRQITPSECRTALGVEAAVTAQVRPSTDTAAVAAAERIAPLLDLPLEQEHVPLFRFLMDSLRATYGEEMLRRAMIAMMFRDVILPERVNVGYFYSFFGAEIEYASSIAVDSSRAIDQRIWAVDAIGYGTAEGRYDDRSGLAAVASAVCDMAYMVRPFTAGLEAKDYGASAQSQDSVWRADDLFYYGLSNLALMARHGGLELLERYASWEPDPVLRERASEAIELAKFYSRQQEDR